MPLTHAQLVVGKRYESEEQRRRTNRPMFSVVLDEFAPFGYRNFAQILQTARGTHTAFLFSMQSLPQLMQVGRGFKEDVTSAPNTTLTLRTRDEETARYFLRASAEHTVTRRSVSMHRQRLFGYEKYEATDRATESQDRETRALDEHIKNLPKGQMEILMTDDTLGTLHQLLHVRPPQDVTFPNFEPKLKDAWRILDALAQPYRTIVLIALCFGLRISEILGLRWTDFDFKRSAVLIQRSAVGKRLNKLKTECSQDEVPLERGFIVELKKWQELCLESEGQWLFPSPATGRPLHADSIRADYLVPTGLQLGLGRIGFHTFRHTYRAWLDETGAPVGVQQKLMRHAHISTTMDQYGNASMEAKRKANRPVVQRLLKRTAASEALFVQ